MSLKSMNCRRGVPPALQSQLEILKLERCVAATASDRSRTLR
jgi:hypothetical protein